MAVRKMTETLTRVNVDEVPVLDVEGLGKEKTEARMEDIALKALHVDDDPTLNPWTFRMLFLGKSVCPANR